MAQTSDAFSSLMNYTHEAVALLAWQGTLGAVTSPLSVASHQVQADPPPKPGQ